MDVPCPLHRENMIMGMDLDMGMGMVMPTDMVMVIPMDIHQERVDL